MITRIVTKNGNKMFDIGGKLFAPAACFSFRPTPANVSLFYRNGVRLFQLRISGLKNTWNMNYSNYGGVWVGDHTYDFAALDRQMEMFMKFAPDGYFMLVLQLDMPEWWRTENNCEFDSYVRLCDASLEEKWVKDASDYLQAFIRYAEEKYGDRVFMYGMTAGQSNEWFDHKNFSHLVGDRRLADYRQKIGEPDAVIPSKEEFRSKALPSLREDDDPVYKFRKYSCGLVPDLILRFARSAQEVLDHKKLIGLFYGYATMTASWQNRCSINGFEKVWASNDIDMLFAPAAYSCRRLQDASSFQNNVDSVAVNNKLYVHEIDHHTYLSKYPSENGQIMDCIYDDEPTTIAVLRREFCALASKGGCLYWFDMQGGWYASPGLEAEIQHEMHIFEELCQHPRQSVSEIAAFVDPMSYNRMKDCSMVSDCGQSNRNSLHHCGAPYDLFNLNDITKIDLGRYKMLVFLNAIEMSDEVKKTIAQKAKNITKVWLYAPNKATGGIAEVCPIGLQEIKDTTLKVQYGERVFGFADPVAPMYAVCDKDAEILATYTNGTPACARKGKDVYIAVGNVPFELWRDLAKAAGVHIYTDTPGAFYADSRFVARQTVWETDITIHMPFDCVVEEMFDGGIYKTENKDLKYTAERGKTKLFIIRDITN